MLEAQRDQLLAGVKQGALSLRMAELDALSQRFISLISVTSLAAGFAFSAMVEIELPEIDSVHLHVTVYVFYISAAIALSLALYVVVISTFAVITGYRLALLGGQNLSLDRAVAVLLKEFRSVCAAAAAGVLAIVVAAAAIGWVKMQEVGLLIPLSVIYFINVCMIARGLRRVRERMRIDKGAIVHGDATLVSSDGERVNLAEIEVPNAVNMNAPKAASSGSATPSEAVRASLMHQSCSQHPGMSSSGVPFDPALVRQSYQSAVRLGGSAPFPKR